ncbi:MAG: SCO family protein [Burkholderiaceae bacterium]|jgi:protein SCO1/2|nr:SCO family protein [Burkholderiaceae bacterium]
MKPLLNYLLRFLSIASLLVVSGCSEPDYKWSLYDVSGHLPDLEFSLKGVGNKTVTQVDLKNKTVLVFFGYASCPDICPTTMAQLTEVIAKLGDDARDVRILFISVDPHRDTPDMLQAYVDAFNKNAVGLTGSEKEVAALARRYRIAYQIEKPKPGDSSEIYDVTHSRGVFIFDRFGKARLLASDTEAIDTVTADLRRLIQTTRAK